MTLQVSKYIGVWRNKLLIVTKLTFDHKTISNAVLSNDMKLATSDKSEAVRVLDGLQQLATQNLAAGIRRQVQKVEAGVCNW